MSKKLFNKNIFLVLLVIALFTVGFSTWMVEETVQENISVDVNVGNLNEENNNIYFTNLKANSSIHFDLNDDGKEDDQLFIKISGTINDLNLFNGLNADFKIEGKNSSGTEFEKIFDDLVSTGYLTYPYFASLEGSSEMLDFTNSSELENFNNEGTYWYKFSNEKWNNSSRNFLIVSKISYGYFFDYLNPIEFFSSEYSNGLKKGTEYTSLEKYEILNSINELNSTTSYKCSYNIELRAYSQKISSYDVYFDLDGGTSNNLDLIQKNIKVGSSFSFPDSSMSPTYNGLNFIGRKINDNSTIYKPGDLVTVDENLFGNNRIINIFATYEAYTDNLKHYKFRFYEDNKQERYVDIILAENQTLTYNGDIFNSHNDDTFIGREYKGRIFKSTDNVNEIVDSYSNIYNLTGIWISKNISIRIYNLENPTVFADYEYNETFVFPNGDELLGKNPDFSDGGGINVTRYKLTTYNIDFLPSKALDLSLIYNYQHDIKGLAFYAYVISTNVTIEYSYNDKIYTTETTYGTTYSLPSYNYFKDIFNLSFGERDNYKYIIKNLGNQVMYENDSVTVDSDTFSDLEHNPLIQIEIYYEYLRDITVTWRSDHGASLKTGKPSEEEIKCLNDIITLNYENMYDIHSEKQFKQFTVSVNGTNVRQTTENGATLALNEDIMGGNSSITITLETENTCFTSNTILITSGFKIKKPSEINVDDEVLTFNHFTGKLEFQKIAYYEASNYEYVNVIELYFSDHTKIEIVGEHAFFNQKLMKYEEINSDNVQDKINNYYVFFSDYNNGDKINVAKLVDYKIDYRKERTFNFVTEYNLNLIIDNYLSFSGFVKGLYNYFDVNENLAYDKEKMKYDINKYGLFKYDDLSEYLSEREFEVYNAKYLKVSIGKGLLTFNRLLSYINTYLR